jgi:hypothetical protein
LLSWFFELLLIIIDPVTSTVLHGSGSVVATCSGQRKSPSIGDIESNEDDTVSDEGTDEGDNEDQASNPSLRLDSRTPDNAIKIWSL